MELYTYGSILMVLYLWFYTYGYTFYSLLITLYLLLLTYNHG